MSMLPPPSFTDRLLELARTHARVTGWIAAGVLSVTGLIGASAATGASGTPPPPPPPTATATATSSATPTVTSTATVTQTATATPTNTPVPPTATPPPPTSTPVPPPPPPPPTSTPVPPPPSAVSSLAPIGMDAFSQALFEATNRRRASVGLPPLVANGYLNAIAKMRSDEMAQYNYFAHTSPITGENVFDLMDRYGVPFGWAGENLAKNNYPDNETVAVADEALWDSPAHHENIVNVNYRQVGIALTVDATGMKYFTVVFTD